MVTSQKKLSATWGHFDFNSFFVSKEGKTIPAYSSMLIIKLNSEATTEYKTSSKS